MTIDKSLNLKLESFITHNEYNLVQDIINLIGIKSLRGGETKEMPFGPQCAKALDHMLNLSATNGFDVKNHDYYYGSCILKGASSEKSIGIVCHLDVVPAEEDGWKRQPFDSYVENGYIVGRGATDNKGPAVAALYVLKFMRDNKIALKNDVRLIFGCDEESGMQDMERYVANTNLLSEITLVPDAPWPVCYAEKGRIEFLASIDIANSNLVDFHAGEVSNSTPGFASALLSGVSFESVNSAIKKIDPQVMVTKSDNYVCISVAGISKHTATPEDSVDAAHLLASALCESKLLTPTASNAIHALKHFTSDYYGESFNIAASDDILGKLTHSCSLVRICNGKLTVSCDIRYPIRVEIDKINSNIKATLNEAGYSLERFNNNAPNYMPSDSPLVVKLTEIANLQIGTDFAPATMGGGTYARKIPNAIGYGPSRPDIQKPFPKGHGWAHQVNEAIRIKNLTDLIRVYVPAIIDLDSEL